MRHAISAAVESGTSTIVIAVDKCLTRDDHATIGLMAPAILALVNKMRFDVWFDDETKELILKEAEPRITDLEGKLGGRGYA